MGGTRGPVQCEPGTRPGGWNRPAHLAGRSKGKPPPGTGMAAPPSRTCADSLGPCQNSVAELLRGSANPNGFLRHWELCQKQWVLAWVSRWSAAKRRVSNLVRVPGLCANSTFLSTFLNVPQTATRSTLFELETNPRPQPFHCKQLGRLCGTLGPVNQPAGH